MAQQDDGGGSDDDKQLNGTEQQLKLVLVGDGDVGKTCLALCFSKDEFPEEYVPTICDNYFKKIVLVKENTQYTQLLFPDTDNIPHEDNNDNNNNNNRLELRYIGLNIYDTAGTESYDGMRALVYPQTDVFVVCFSLVNRVSFENTRKRWVSELRDTAADTPVVLVGTKGDLRQSRDADEVVSSKEAQELAMDMQVAAYVETSAKQFAHVRDAFRHAVVSAVLKKERDERTTEQKEQEQEHHGHKHKKKRGGILGLFAKLTGRGRSEDHNDKDKDDDDDGNDTPNTEPHIIILEQ